MLTSLFPILMIGCNGDNDYVYISSVEPPDDSRLEPGSHSIVVTFDGKPEGLEAFWNNPSSKAVFELSGNTLTFSKHLEIGSSATLFLTWENIDETEYDLFYSWADIELGYECASDAVVTLTDDIDDVEVPPPWPKFANFKGPQNSDSLRFEFPIYMDKALAYDLPVNLEAQILLEKDTPFYGPITNHIPSLESWMRFSCIMDKGSTKFQCPGEIPVEDEYGQWDLTRLRIRLLPGPYVQGESTDLAVHWEGSKK